MNSTIEKINKAGDDFLKHKSSIIIFISLIIGTGILNIILFSSGFIGIKTPFFPDEEIMIGSSLAWIAWISLVLSLSGSIFNIWTFFLIVRKDTKFLGPLIIGSILTIPNEFFLGAIFSAISWVMLFFVEVWTWFEWKKEETSETKKIKTNYLIIFIIWLIFITICSALIFSVDFFTQGGQHYLIPVLDVLSSSAVLVCWTLTLMKNKWGLAGMIFTDISYVVIYFTQGSLALAMTFLIYIVVDSIGFVSWGND